MADKRINRTSQDQLTINKIGGLGKINQELTDGFAIDQKTGISLEPKTLAEVEKKRKEIDENMKDIKKHQRRFVDGNLSIMTSNAEIEYDLIRKIDMLVELEEVLKTLDNTIKSYYFPEDFKYDHEQEKANYEKQLDAENLDKKTKEELIRKYNKTIDDTMDELTGGKDSVDENRATVQRMKMKKIELLEKMGEQKLTDEERDTIIEGLKNNDRLTVHDTIVRGIGLLNQIFPNINIIDANDSNTFINEDMVDTLKNLGFERGESEFSTIIRRQKKQ